MSELEKALERTPCSIADRAFHICVFNSASNEELVADFKRLRGLGAVNKDFAREFMCFVHEYVYSRLDACTLTALRGEMTVQH